jgi:hypothetical protein
MRKLFTAVAATLGLAGLIAGTSPAGSAVISGLVLTGID